MQRNHWKREEDGKRRKTAEFNKKTDRLYSSTTQLMFKK